MDELDAENRETLMKANLDLLVAMLVLALGLLHVKFPFEGGQDETKKSKIYLRTLQALEQIGRTFTVDELEHVICLKYAEKVDQKLAHSQAAALKSMVRTLFTICLFVWHACFFSEGLFLTSTGVR